MGKGNAVGAGVGLGGLVTEIGSGVSTATVGSGHTLVHVVRGVELGCGLAICDFSGHTVGTGSAVAGVVLTLAVFAVQPLSLKVAIVVTVARGFGRHTQHIHDRA